MIMTAFKDVLAQKPLLGFCSMYASPGIVERIGQDWDWCWIDGQHGEWGAHDIVQAVRACNLAGIFALVRVPGQDPAAIGKALDTGCHAVMVPMVNSRQQAEAAVDAARFAPLGQRSYGGRRPIDLYGRAYAHADHPQPLVVCQIESPEALEAMDDIASVPGVDALFFGPDDLALARGLPMDQPRPEGYYDAEYAALAAATRRHGKIAAGIFSTPATRKQAIAQGYRLIICTGDVGLLSANSLAQARAARTEIGQTEARAAGGPAALY